MPTPKKLVRAVLERDNYICVIQSVYCTQVATTADHRANRGMGGSKQLDQPECLIAACWPCNGAGKEDAVGEARAELVARGIRVQKRATNAQTAERCTNIPVQYADGWFRLEGFARVPIKVLEAVEYMVLIGEITTGKGWAF